jgi:agmatine/peptidylarginine deiminase
VTIVANDDQEAEVLTQYENYGVNLDNCAFLHAPTDSYWVRDYGPWFIFDGNDQPGIVDFPYNRPRPSDNNIPGEVAEMLEIDLYGMNIVHTGGNYMTDGMGQSSSTELVWEENELLTAEQIDSIVMSYLAVSEYHVLPDPLGDYIDHIDTWAKFLSPNKILIGQVPEMDDRYEDFEYVANYFATTLSSYGKPYEVFRVYTPGGNPATPYTNSLIVNDKVFVPLSGSQHDDAAIASYEEAMPGYEIIGISYGGWYNTDALHCRAKGVADLGMLYIDHMPILGTVVFEESYELMAEINAISGADIYPDSVLIYYRTADTGDFSAVNMTLESGDTWKGTITGVSPGDHVDYYIYAADESGRRMKHPYIGDPDPHEFYAFGLQTDILEVTPDTITFETPDDCVEGKTVHIINISNNPIDVEYISPESENGVFYWWVEELPNLPYTIQPDDTLTIDVFVALPLKAASEYTYDSLIIESLDDQYHCILEANNDLISVIDEEMIRGLEVYPNPFKDELNFSFEIMHAGEVNFEMYDRTGKLVYKKLENLPAGNQSLRLNTSGLDLSPGLYIYRIRTGTQMTTGKVIFE